VKAKTRSFYKMKNMGLNYRQIDIIFLKPIPIFSAADIRLATDTDIPKFT